MLNNKKTRRKENFHLKKETFRYKISVRDIECSHRLAVRTSDSHSGNTGSIPVGSAKILTWAGDDSCEKNQGIVNGRFK